MRYHVTIGTRAYLVDAFRATDAVVKAIGDHGEPADGTPMLVEQVIGAFVYQGAAVPERPLRATPHEAVMAQIGPVVTVPREQVTMDRRVQAEKA